MPLCPTTTLTGPRSRSLRLTGLSTTDSVRQTWFQFHQVSNSSYYVYDYTTGRTNVVWNAVSFPVVPGHAYTFSLRIGWVNPAPSPGGGAMAAAYHWFDQPGDLR